MKCPRCKTVPEDDDALYCLVCGKRLKRDDAFDGEFEEEFRFDEEIEEEKALIEERARLRRKEQNALALKCLGVSLAVALFLLIFYLLLRPTPAPNTEEAPPKSDVTLNEPSNALSADETEKLTDTCRKLLVAGSETYDLDALLRCVYPTVQDDVLASLCETYDCENRAELEARFRELSETDAYRFKNTTFSVGEPIEGTELELLRAAYAKRLSLSDDKIRFAVRVTVATTAVHNDTESFYTAEYLFAKIGDGFYSLDF
ncbi:MAG: hypothetical protein II328_00250 [Clostridia bacterium]|nr:hypothetical protein [Clostridia bacterium]